MHTVTYQQREDSILLSPGLRQAYYKRRSDLLELRWHDSQIVSHFVCVDLMALFRNDEKLDIPTKDILSWIFSDQKYDQDEPVSNRLSSAYF